MRSGTNVTKKRAVKKRASKLIVERCILHEENKMVTKNKRKTASSLNCM